MKVLLLGPNIDDPTQIGGIITVIQTILSEIRNDYIYFSRSPKWNEKGIVGKLKWAGKIIKFINLLNKEKPNVIHMHTAMNNSALYRDCIWLLISLALRKPTLLHIHGGTYLFKHPEGIVKRVLNCMLFSSSKIIVLSHTEKSELHNRYKLNLNKIEVLENAINLKQIPQFSKTVINQSLLNIIFLGRICESKGIDDIIDALLILEATDLNFNFYLCGQGELEKSTVEKLKSSLKSGFVFLGVVSGVSKWKALNDADVFLLPSRYGEGLPMGILEAMALGRLVVTTNDASIGVAVSHGINGFIVDKYNPEAIAKQICEIARMDPISIQKIQDAAQKTIEERFSSGIYMKKLENIYQNCINP